MVSHWPKFESGANRQIGPSEERLLLRAINSKSGQVVIDPKTENAAWCAAKRLTQRGLMRRQRFGSRKLGFILIFQVTQRGIDKMKEYRER